MGLVVRHADPERDASACAAIYAPHVRDGTASFEEVVPDAQEMAQRIERASGTHAWLVAERDAAVVGWASASPHRVRAAYRWTADCAIYVDERAQRSGAGRALYEALLALLRRQGMRTVCAGITLPNAASVGLHEAMGFRLVGVFRSVGFKAGAWRDVGWFQLDLGGSGDPPQEPLGPQLLD